MTGECLPQSDSALRIFTYYGGRPRDPSTPLFPYTTLFRSICESSATYDLGPKLRLYEKAGVPEYITMLIGEQEIIWRGLNYRRYSKTEPDAGGILRSRVFPGLWLNPEAALALDFAGVLNAL